MRSYQIAIPVIILAALVGLLAGLWMNPGSIGIGSFEVPELEDREDQPPENRTIGRLGSTHDHALFHVVVNGSEKDFTAGKFQFNSRYVHLENNKSDILHKHATGVTWKIFLDTLNISTSTGGNQTCIEIYGNRSCGTGSVVLNGEFNASLDQEISQGDNLLIILDTEDWRNVSKRYMEKRLPEDYRPQSRDGRSL